MNPTHYFIFEISQSIHHSIGERLISQDMVSQNGKKKQLLSTKKKLRFYQQNKSFLYVPVRTIAKK